MYNSFNCIYCVKTVHNGMYYGSTRTLIASKSTMCKFNQLTVFIKLNVPIKDEVSPGLEPGTFCV